MGILSAIFVRKTQYFAVEKLKFFVSHEELCNFIELVCLGMSTAIEVIGARHCGMRVLAMSLVTDKAFSDVDSDEMISHDIVLAEAKKNAPIMESLVTKFLQKLQV